MAVGSLKLRNELFAGKAGKSLNKKPAASCIRSDCASTATSKLNKNQRKMRNRRQRMKEAKKSTEETITSTDCTTLVPTSPSLIEEENIELPVPKAVLITVTTKEAFIVWTDEHHTKFTAQAPLHGLFESMLDFLLRPETGVTFEELYNDEDIAVVAQHANSISFVDKPDTGRLLAAASEALASDTLEFTRSLNSTTGFVTYSISPFVVTLTLTNTEDESSPQRTLAVSSLEEEEEVPVINSTYDKLLASDALLAWRVYAQRKIMTRLRKVQEADVTSDKDQEECSTAIEVTIEEPIVESVEVEEVIIEAVEVEESIVEATIEQPIVVQAAEEPTIVEEEEQEMEEEQYYYIDYIELAKDVRNWFYSQTGRASYKSIVTKIPFNDTANLSEDNFPALSSNANTVKVSKVSSVVQASNATTVVCSGVPGLVTRAGKKNLRRSEKRHRARLDKETAQKATWATSLFADPTTVNTNNNAISTASTSDVLDTTTTVATAVATEKVMEGSADVRARVVEKFTKILGEPLGSKLEVALWNKVMKSCAADNIALEFKGTFRYRYTTRAVGLTTYVLKTASLVDLLCTEQLGLEDFLNEQWGGDCPKKWQPTSLVSSLSRTSSVIEALRD